MHYRNPASTHTVGEYIAADRGPQFAPARETVSGTETYKHEGGDSWAYDREQRIAFALKQAELGQRIGRALWAQMQRLRDAGQVI